MFALCPKRRPYVYLICLCYTEIICGSNLTQKVVSAFPKEVGTRVLDFRNNPTEKWQFSGYSSDGLKTGVSSVVTLLTEGPPWVFWFIFVLNHIQMHQLVFSFQRYLTGFFVCTFIILQFLMIWHTSHPLYLQVWNLIYF